MNHNFLSQDLGSTSGRELALLRAENASLRASLQAALDLIQISPAFIGYVSCDGKILNLNSLALSIIEASREKIIGSTFWECDWWNPLPSSAERVRVAIEEAARGKASKFDLEYWTIQEGIGSKRWVALAATPVRETNGLTSRVAISGIDITERMLAESAFAFERHQLETLFMQSPAAMVLWTGPDFVFEKVNPQYQAIFPDRELKGKAFLDACPEFKDQPFQDLLKKVLATGEPFIGREVLARHAIVKDGPIVDRYYDFTYMRVSDAAGNPYGVYDHAIDVTDRVLNARRLEAAKHEAERANLSKTAFLANMSHEIRTPMTAVLGFTELLRGEALPENARQEALHRIDTSGRALLRIIDDVLDISKVEAGKLSMEKKSFSPVEILNEIEALFRLQAEQKGLMLVSKFSEDVPTIAHSDAARLRQILTNLVGNAIKFTQKGQVSIELRTEEEAEGQKEHLCFEVTDTGIGIAEMDQQKLFHPFVQADESITRTFGGTGLGLVLSRRLCQQLGGDLFLVESRIGLGSRFIAKIAGGPFKREKQIIPPQKTTRLYTNQHGHAPLNAMHILVVDDIPDNQVLMKLYLESAGARVDVAFEGMEAISKATNQAFDVILMDIQMPHMDGIQATKHLRNSGYTRPILALTAHAMAEEIKYTSEAGCDDHLTKPITKEALINAIWKHSQRQAEGDRIS